MKLTVDEILTSPATCDENLSYKLGLYIALNEDNKIYYTGSREDNLIVELAEMYFNEFAYITILENSVYNPNPIHVLRYHHVKNDMIIKSNVLLYSNGAVSYDQGKDNSTIHLWIDRMTVEIFKIPNEELFKSLY